MPKTASSFFNQFIFLLSTHFHICISSCYQIIWFDFSRRFFRTPPPSRFLCLSANTVRRFVPVTLAEWCQLHKDSCRAQKYRRGCWRRRLSVLEGINQEKERGPSASEQKGPYVLEGEARNRERRKGARKRESRENPLSKEGDPMNEKTGRKIHQSQSGTAMALFKNHCERGEEVKKVKVWTNAMNSPSLFVKPPPFTLPYHNQC